MCGGCTVGDASRWRALNLRAVSITARINVAESSRPMRLGSSRAVRDPVKANLQSRLPTTCAAPSAVLPRDCRPVVSFALGCRRAETRGCVTVRSGIRGACSAHTPWGEHKRPSIRTSRRFSTDLPQQKCAASAWYPHRCTTVHATDARARPAPYRFPHVRSCKAVWRSAGP